MELVRWYGRLPATFTSGTPATLAKSTVAALPATTRTPGMASFSSTAIMSRSFSTAVTRAPVAARKRVRCPRPGPSSTTGSPSRSSSDVGDGLQDVRVPEEVLPPAVLGPQAMALEDFTWRIHSRSPFTFTCARPGPRTD